MSHKTCSKCQYSKPLNAFHKDKTRPDGAAYTCKACKRDMPSRARGTLAYFIRRSWDSINGRTINGAYKNESNPRNKTYFRKGIRLEMSRDAFKAFCQQNKSTIDDIYQQGETPSVDRIDATKHYSIDNIQIISLSENLKRRGQ